MCGIAGVYHPGTPKPVDRARVLAMADAQAHRGPDGAGVWTAPGVGLSHRRLAIIDVAGSPQPMQDGDLTVTYNGEIYNFAEVRAELQAGDSEPWVQLTRGQADASAVRRIVLERLGVTE